MSYANPHTDHTSIHIQGEAIPPSLAAPSLSYPCEMIMQQIHLFSNDTKCKTDP